MSDPSPTSAASGAAFVRADLHVHSHADGDVDPRPDFDAYIEAAIESEVKVIGITDHNTARFCRDAIKAAAGKDIVVIPGIEISTRDGHLLALFAPEEVDTLESFATAEKLALKELSETEQRSERSMLHLVEEIGARGGLAIPAHVDASNGCCEKLDTNELADLIANPHLGGLEFATSETLETWFTDKDPDPKRLEAWKRRQAIAELRERGLGRLMSSDAHSPEKVGLDRAVRTMTRLRVDDPNFAALRNAIQLNPKARCRAEVILPAAYPRILRARFEGGFLDGASIDFTGNLNCLIGSRGSGKSTALLSIRVALGAKPPPDEDPDDPDRMPDRTEVAFLDQAGSERVAIRERGKLPVDKDGSPIRLRMADMGQDESGRLADGYNETPEDLLAFLDGFIVRHKFDETEQGLIAELEENAAEVTRTSGTEAEIKKLSEEQARLEASLKAATDSKVEQVAEWAQLLASQKPLLEQIEASVAQALAGTPVKSTLDLDALANDFSVDLSKGLAAEFVEGKEGLRAQLSQLDAKREELSAEAKTAIATPGAEVKGKLEEWKAKQVELEGRLEAKRRELKAHGLEVQAGAIVNLANRLKEVKKRVSSLREKSGENKNALETRTKLLEKLHQNRDRLFEQRKMEIDKIVAAANRHSDDLTLHVYFERGAISTSWTEWLSTHFPLREPRVARIGELIGPKEFGEKLVVAPGDLESLEEGGSAPFSEEAIKTVRAWPQIFALQTMRLEDRPRIKVQRKGSPDPQPFDHLSAGQQRSVLLSLLLCAERSEPLVLDQPEDHLDGQYIADAVVRHLEAAKERRQVLIATHSANLVVLGDAELVVPMVVDSGNGKPYDVGAVDRPSTRDRVCALLEGGKAAYKERGKRYGFRFDSEPSS